MEVRQSISSKYLFKVFFFICHLIPAMSMRTVEDINTLKPQASVLQAEAGQQPVPEFASSTTLP